ncbi:MAG TPA: two-component regulator propeller domain-containing protein, partial [Bacteroidales bacterium]|nr:two-component regulator propeller domain-containing protein [Bacteroidales bacterium]
RGFLWVCTNNGLFRYDGYSFKDINSLVSGYLKFETYCVVEDKNQNLWIGTAGNGLVYYDTRKGKLFSLKLNESNKLKVNRILFFKKKVWIATNEGLLVVDEQENIDESTVFKAKVLWPDPEHKALQMNVINYIYAQPGSNKLWIGTNSPLYELDTDTYRFRVVNCFNQNSIRWISAYANDKMLVSSWDGGIFLFNPRSFKIENDTYVNEINKIVGSRRIKTAIVDKQNRYWIATFGDGLYIFSKDKKGSLHYENYRNEEKLPLKLKSNFVDQIFLDETGTAWLSMAESGLSRIYYRKSNFQYFNFQRSVDETGSKEIHAMRPSSDRNKFWVSFNRNEIDLFDSRSNSYKQFTSTTSGLQLQNDKINVAWQDRYGNLWIVYSRIGIYVVPAKDAMSLLYDKPHNTVKPIDANILFSSDSRANSYITCFFEDSKGRLWVGAWGNMYVLTITGGFMQSNSTAQMVANSRVDQIYAEERRDQYKFTISPVNSIIEVGANRFWLGTRNRGITEIEEVSDHKFVGRELSLNDKLPGTYINCFYRDKNKTLWIGTNAGLCYLDKSGFQVIGIKDGLSSDCITNIVDDNYKNIWISTSYGISRISHGDFSVINFNHSDNEGLNQFIVGAYAITPGGNIWFSNNESLVKFNADSIENFRITAPVYFTDIRINNHNVIPSEQYRGISIISKDINLSKTINVPYGSTLNIEFAALDYLNPDKILYKYKIGNTNEWLILSPGQRSLNLPNTNPGEYVLSIMVTNSIGENSSRSIKINYLPPFWLSKTAIVIYFLIVLVLLLTGRKLIIQKTLQKSLVEKERYERKKLEELDRMKTEFFSNISHEFRTPLSLIINPLEKLVKEDNLAEKDKNKIKLVLKSSNRLLKLTNELMDFSKIEKELLKPDFQLCEIVSMTTEICQLFNNLADTMDIDFRINHSFERLELPIDKGMIEKAIFNLLSNAFKYTSAHGVIMVDLSKTFEPGKEYVKLSVINTGEGITEENLSRVFDRFYQVNNVQNKKVEGTGIGLALVKGFVELHNGKVEVKSEPNLETSFDIYIPMFQPDFQLNNECDVAANKKMMKYVKSPAGNDNTCAKQSAAYRILVIEDEEDVRNYIVDELSSDYKMLMATNGEEGLSIANETIPDLIITDVIMPVMTGMDLCKKLRTQVITSHIPIIILSAKADTKEQIEGLEKGADVYMIKPFNIGILKVQVQRLINLKQSIYSKYLKETVLIPQDSVTNKLDDDFMKKVLTFIEDNITDSDLNVDQLANCVALSKVQTYRKVKAISGLSIVEFIRTVRLKKAAQLILEGHLNFSEIAFETGFSTPSYFSKCFHDHFAKTPSEFAFEFGKKEIVGI